MKLNWYAAFYLAVACFVVGCGSDDSVNATNPEQNQNPAEQPVEIKPSIFDTLIVQTSANLPTCDASREGRAFFAQGENIAYFCVNSVWRKAADSTDFSITCSDGFLKAVNKINHPFKPDYDTVAFTGVWHRDIHGIAQKGPFMFGSVVRWGEWRNGNFTGYSDSACILSNDGRFIVENVNTSAETFSVSVTGYYKNEVTGRPSDKPITLEAKTLIHEDMPLSPSVLNRDSVNINLLTHLSSPRRTQLTNSSVPNGAAQAEREVFAAFGIDTVQLYSQNYWTDGRTDKPQADDLNLLGNSEYSAALLAISVMLQGGRNEDEMMNLVYNLAEDIKGDGVWNDQNWKIKIADWIVGIDSSWGYNEIRNNVSAWGQGPVPNFEKYVRGFIPIAYGFGECSDANAGQVTYVNQGQSIYFANDYEHADHSTVRFICDANSKQWRVATAMEKDTAGFGLGEYDREIREGRVSHDTYYIFDSGAWREATPQEADGFTDIAEVYASLQPSDKAVFIIRHSERTDDTGPKGQLTENGRLYAHNLGARLAAIANEDFYYGYSGYVRTEETCREIAVGKGQLQFSIDILPYMNGNWYVKDNAKASDYVSADGGWTVYSKYGFAGAYEDAFYDLKTRSDELIKDSILANIGQMKRVNFMCTHDYLVVPLLAYVTDGHANVRFYEKWKWVNYLAGVAMIISADGSIRYVPVKGLETGTM